MIHVHTLELNGDFSFTFLEKRWKWAEFRQRTYFFHFKRDISYSCQRFFFFTTFIYILLTNFSVEKITLSTSNHIFPSYQGESTIFDNGNFLYQTPDTKNLLIFKGVILPHPPLSRSKKRANSKIIHYLLLIALSFQFPLVVWMHLLQSFGQAHRPASVHTPS